MARVRISADGVHASYRPGVRSRDPRLGLGLIIAATVTTLVVGALGPSVVTLTLGPRDGFLPPWYLPAGVVSPDEWAVSIAIWLAIAAGAVGLVVCLRALADGWRPHHRRIFALGATLSSVTILVPPLTSADVLMYAGYGRLQVLGRNPYDITPAEIFRSQYDPVLKWTEQPWWDTPSVYGPITSWTQWLSSRLGGESMHDTVFWLQVFCLVPFLIACAAVVWLAHGDPRLQARAALLSVCNPLLIWAVVASAHNEAQSVMFAVLAIMLMRRNSVAAGFLIGLAGCCKLSIGLYGLAMLWAYRHQPRKMVGLCVGAVIPIGLAYGLWQPAALIQVLRNTTYVSAGSWASPLFGLLDLFMPAVVARSILNVIAIAAMVLVIWMLSKILPWRAAPGLLPGADPLRDPITIALRTALMLSTGWLLTSIYTLSWYDLIAWAPLAVLGATPLDRIFTIRGAALSAAFVPGRTVELGAALDFFAARMRDTVSFSIQVGVVVTLVLWWRRVWLLPRRELMASGLDPDAPATRVVPRPVVSTRDDPGKDG